MSLTKLSLGGNYDVIYKLFLAWESLVSDIPAGDGNIEKLFLRCMSLVVGAWYGGMADKSLEGGCVGMVWYEACGWCIVWCHGW